MEETNRLVGRWRHSGRADRRRGAELLEFTFTLLPLLAILFLLFDASWAIFAKATLQYAVQRGVRTGITITGTQARAANETLTQMVKDTVQASALGLLNGTAGRNLIFVNYLSEDASSGTGVTDVSSLANGNLPGNVMQVSVSNFQLPCLLPRIYGWFIPPDKSPTTINAVSADEIEPSADVPTKGAAP